MRLIEAFGVALSSLLANRLRSVLATLGIMIGIAAVSTLLSVGQSFRIFVNKQFAGLETDSITIQAQPDFGGGDVASQPQLTDADIAALRKLPNITAVVARYTGDGEVRSGPLASYGSIVGADLSYLRPGKAPVLGRFLQQKDLDDRARVAVLSWQFAQQLFPDGRPLGRRVALQGLSCTVIGVLPETQNSFFRNPFEAVVPMSTARDRLFPASAVSRVQVTDATLYMSDSRAIDSTQAAIKALLRQRHKLRPEQGSDFSIPNVSDFVRTNNTILLGITAFLGVIGGIALLVGGIGITNIMLVSVTERTQEIGLRKAVGARRTDIMRQFLIEAVALSLFGGVAGVVVSAVLVQLGAIAIQAFLPDSGLASALSLDIRAVLLALIFASLVGVVAGSYPAFRASRLSPISALRSVT